MQNKKKKVLVVALIVSLIAIISLGSLAWFTDNDTVTNTLKFSDTFSVDVYETDENGLAVFDENGETSGRTYTDIMPGQTIHKDPTVWNDGTHPEWVRVTVTLNDGLTWGNILAANGVEEVKLADFFKNYDENKWTCTTHAQLSPNILSGDRSLSWVFYLNDTLAPGATATLFDKVVIPGSLTNEQAAELGGQFTIKVAAEAIQSEFLPEGVTTAQQAFALLEAAD